METHSPEIRTGRRLVVDTRDPDFAREIMSQVYCPHVLTVSDGRSFHAVHDEASLGPVSVHGLAFGTSTIVDTEPLESWILVSTPLTGGLGVSSEGIDRHVLPGKSIVLDSFRQFRLRFSADCRLLTFRFERSFVELALQELRGESELLQVRFGLEGPSSVHDTEAWQAVASLLVRESRARPQASTRPMLQKQLARTAVAALAETHPLQALPGLPPGRSPLTTEVHRVVSQITSQPTSPYQVADLARCAGISVRALQEAFTRQLGTTPMSFLRDVRLRKAHEDLISGRVDTVAEAADRWGFTNLGRFSGQYQSLYGRLPSATLREGAPPRTVHLSPLRP